MANGEEAPREPDVSDETLAELVSVQREEVEVRREEAELSRRELEANKEHALKALDAQREDRDKFWDHQERVHKRGTWVAVLVIILVPAFLGALLYMGHEDFALELVKIALYGGSGYAAGRAANGSESE